MTVTADSPAPYAPASTIIEIINRYRDHGLQTPFTSDVLARAGVSDSLISRTLIGLQVLDLIDEGGNPTEVLTGLGNATQDEMPARLSEWLRATYAEVFQFVDPADASPEGVRDAFRTYQPRGQQPRMVTLFLALCVHAGIRQAPEEGAPRPRAQRRRTPSSQRNREQPNPRRRQSQQEVPGVPQPIAGLLASLPESGRWTKERRDAFMTTFGTVLDFCIEIGEEITDAAPEDQT